MANVKLDQGLSAGSILSLGRTFAQFDSNELTTYSNPGLAGNELDRRVRRRARRHAGGRAVPEHLPGPAAGRRHARFGRSHLLNGTGVDGKAADAAGALQTIGFPIVSVETFETDTVERTTAYYGPYSERMAHLVASYLTGGAALVYDPDVPVGEVTLVVGHDFTTVHDQPTPKGSAEDALITTSTTEATTTSEGQTTTTVPPTTTTSAPGYATGEPPEGVTC